MSTIERVGVVGCGQMGSGIAEICGRAGLDVVVVETGSAEAAAGSERVERSLRRAVQAGRLEAAESASALARLRFTTQIGELADRQIVIEAIAEDEDAKLEVFRALDETLSDPEALLASNTSSIPVTRLARATARPQQVLGLHFFNPVPVLALVELVRSQLCSDRSARRAEEFAREVLGRKVIRVKDRAGFVVNSLLVPYLVAAVRMVDDAVATPQEIDAGMVEGCAHPMGPLALCDLIGLDTVLAVADSLFEEHRAPHLAAPPLLRRMCEAGLLGRKAGRGFYLYTDDGHRS